MTTARKLLDSHVVDILGSTKGRDQPIMVMEKAMDLVGCIDNKLFFDPDTVFIDPFCKAGEILLACAMQSCLLKNNNHGKLISIDKVYHELYGGRFYALAPDERHFLLSKRTYYGNENSHQLQKTSHIRCGNYLSEIDGRLIEGKFETELKNMINYIKSKKPGAKIIAFGNPPYQEADGGGRGSSAKPVYNHFVDALIGSDQISQFVLVIPSRWFIGGKGLDEFRENLMRSKHIRFLQHFERSGEVFPTVDIDGGVCFLNYDKSFSGDPEFASGNSKITLDLTTFDVIPDDPNSITILNKVRKIWTNKWISDVAQPRNIFGVPAELTRPGAKQETNRTTITCIARNRALIKIPRDKVTKCQHLIDMWKVCIPKAYGGLKGNRRMTMPARHFFMVEPGVVVSETYLVLGSFNSKLEAGNYIQFLKTDFARYLLGLRKLTQNISRDTWTWVPFITARNLLTNDQLYEHFELSKSEREHISKKVKEWSR